jgi:hypothetical protein
MEVFMEEVWINCPGWDNFYEVSSHSRVRSKKRPVQTPLGVSNRGGRVLKQIAHSTGYLCVNLTGGGERRQELIHRLVLLAFKGACPDGYQACHNNGIRSDCQLSNLRWDTVAGNHADKSKHGTAQVGAKNPHSRLTEEQAQVVKYSGKPLKKLALEFGVSFGCVDKIRYGQSWRHL